MKLVTFLTAGSTDVAPSCGLLTEAGVHDLSARFGATLASVLAEPEALRRLADSCLPTRPDHALADLHLRPPFGPDTKIVCVGLNYRAHIAETGRSDPGMPTLFIRWPDSHVAHGMALVRPAASERFDFEGKIAVLIGRGGRHIPAAEALRHVGGYSCYNDGSIRDWQRHTSQFTPGKNFASSAAIGPWIVTADEIADPAALSLTTRLNGTVMQHATVSDMIHGIADLIAYISIFTPLRPGDVIATGTPEGVGAYRTPPAWLRPGDRIEVDVSGIGTLVNTVVAEAGLPGQLPAAGADSETVAFRD